MTKNENNTGQRQSKELKSEEKKQYNKTSFKPIQIKIAGTPFTAIKREKKGKWEIAMGLEIVTYETFKTIRKAEKFIKKKPWILIENLNLIYTKRMVEYLQKNKK